MLFAKLNLIHAFIFHPSDIHLSHFVFQKRKKMSMTFSQTIPMAVTREVLVGFMMCLYSLAALCVFFCPSVSPITSYSIPTRTLPLRLFVPLLPHQLRHSQPNRPPVKFGRKWWRWRGLCWTAAMPTLCCGRPVWRCKDVQAAVTPGCCSVSPLWPPADTCRCALQTTV